MDLLHTVFTIIQNNIRPPHSVRSTLSALYPPWEKLKKKRQQGMLLLLSCQLMINGSAFSPSQRPSTNRPRVVQKGGRCRAAGPFPHCAVRFSHIYFARDLASPANAIQHVPVCSPLTVCISLMTPSALISLVCSKPPLQLQRVHLLNKKKETIN